MRSPTRFGSLSIAALITPLSFQMALRSNTVDALLRPDYAPRRALYLAHPGLLWTNVLSDVLIALSYVGFLVGIGWLVRKIKDIPELRNYLWVLTVFRVFIIASGGNVLIRIVTIWWPLFQFSIVLKIVCAAAAAPTAIIFVAQAPAMAESLRRFFILLSTEQQNAEKLRKNEEFLDRIGHIAGIGGWEVDLLDNSVTWSAETYFIHAAPPGYQPTLEGGLQIYEEAARPTIMAAVQAASTGGPGWDLELPAVRLDGKKMWVRTVGAVDLQNGKPVRLIGAFQDITAIVEARDALRYANERVALATDSGSIGIYDWDIQNDLCTADRWMHRLWDMEYSGTPSPLSVFASRMHDEDREAVIEALEDGIAGRRPYQAEFRVVRRDGTVRNIRANGQVTRDEAGRAIRMVGVNIDVTEYRNLAAELAEQHELLRVTLQSIADGVITTDAKRNVNWLNPAAERMTGWASEDAVGHPLSEVFQTLNGDTRESIENPVANFPVQGKAVGVARHTVLISRDKTEFGIENAVAPIRSNFGELLGNILIFRDVTEQRRYAAESDRVSKLQLELKTKDEFLSHVSHELRSPLTSIYSFTSIICDGLAGNITEEQSEYLQIVLKNVVQLQAMIEDLLTVTQSREGKLSIELQETSPSEAIEDALHTVQGSAALKQIALSSDHCETFPAACADPTRLRQILIILLDNAVKFTPEGGRVSVHLETKDPGFLLFQVLDTGCGIPPDARTRIFENLYQITGSSQPDTSLAGRTGLGLGLHIARNLVTRQGGNIWVTDAPEHGSIFNFTLPVYTEACLATMVAANIPRRRKTDQPEEKRPELLPAA